MKSSLRDDAPVAQREAARSVLVHVLDVSMRLAHYRGDALLGDMGISTYEARYDDAVEIIVEVSEPAYCFVLALNPDGTRQLCYPASTGTPPPLSREFTSPVLPNGAAGVFGLTDGVGAQACALVASREPLPSWEEWTLELGEMAWLSFDADHMWEHDGELMSPLGLTRGDIWQRPKSGDPSPFESTMSALRNGPGVEAVRGMLFPVRAADGE